MDWENMGNEYETVPIVLFGTFATETRYSVTLSTYKVSWLSYLGSQNATENFRYHIHIDI